MPSKGLRQELNGVVALWAGPACGLFQVKLESGSCGSVEQTALETQRSRHPASGVELGDQGLDIHGAPVSPPRRKPDSAPRITPSPGRAKENSMPMQSYQVLSSFYWQIYFYEEPKKIYIIVTYVHQLYRFYFKFTQC